MCSQLSNKPTIGVFIPTPGRKSLARTVWSIYTQRLIPGDQVVIVGDGYDKWTDDFVSRFGPPFEYLPTPQTRDWGHTQCNIGMRKLQTTVGVAQDDDDIFAPRAFEEIRRNAINFDDKPILARVKTPSFDVLWSTPIDTLLDGHCLIYPNNGKLGTWDSAYDGDQRYIRSTLEHYDTVVWLDKVISLTRPKWKLWNFPLHPEDTPSIYHQLNQLREIRNSCREYMTGNQNEIQWHEQEKWFSELDHENNWYWLFKEALNLKPIGFVGLNRREGSMWATYGIVPEKRGQGWGRELVEFSCWAAQEELNIHVLVSNERAIKLYKKCGFREHWTRNGIIEMYSDWPPRFE